ncbi:MAG TPA: CHAT domain-containing protein [Polyangium sp.]|nr:CHAT domain-containing protein [Polyangium sp.]
MEDNKYHTLKVSIYKFGELFQAELSSTDPESEAQVAPVRGRADFNLSALLEKQSLPAEYGKLLAQQLFHDDELKSHFIKAETAASATGSFQRFILCIDVSAQELQSLRWELLRHPQTNEPFSTTEKVLFSRFIVSRDFRPVRLRARTELSALIAISAPPPAKLTKLGLAPVDFNGESSRIQAVLEGLTIRTLGGPGAPLTLDRLIEALRDGVDIVYLVCHGMFGAKSGAPALILQDDAGEAKVVLGEDIAKRIGELQTGPRLIVLASCQSAGDGKQVEGPAGRTSVQATLAARLADVGVPALVAMQGFITMETVAKMMPVFFSELLRDGQIDRALAAARGRVRERDDAWMPALFTRLTNGRLWYTPGFRTDESKMVWKRLLAPIRHGKVVPILGPRLLAPIHGDSHDVAHALAANSHFPFALHEWDDLPRVAQYMSVTESRNNVVLAHRDQLLFNIIEQHKKWLPEKDIKNRDLHTLLQLVGEHLRKNNADDAYNVLADLPAAVYVTTNFDSLLEQALVARTKTPQQILTRWRYQKAPLPPPDGTSAEPTKTNPIVYHPFGAFHPTDPGQDKFLVLTEDDYFDYLIETSAAKLMPPDVESALVSNSLLFLGFRLTDWHFRVLFRLMMSLPGRKELLKQYSHVAVQLDPDMNTMADVVRGKAYLAKYFGDEANIEIYWGSAQEFLKALRDELSASDGAAAPEVPKPPANNDLDDNF